MKAQMLFELFKNHLTGELDFKEVLILSKLSFYLLITRPINIGAFRRVLNLINPYNLRRHAMKRFQVVFATVLSFVFLMTITSCYTTLKTFHKDDAADVNYYPEESSQVNYAGYNDEDYYYDNNESVAEVTKLEYRPTRLIVTKTYYDYGRYVKKVKYYVYDDYYDPWYDPYYISYYYEPGITVHINFGFNVGYYYPHRYWHRYVYAPGFYVGWGPVYTWYDPWNVRYGKAVKRYGS